MAQIFGILLISLLVVIMLSLSILMILSSIIIIFLRKAYPSAWNALGKPSPLGILGTWTVLLQKENQKLLPSDERLRKQIKIFNMVSHLFFILLFILIALAIFIQFF